MKSQAMLDAEEREEGIWESGFMAGRAFHRAQAEDLVRRAAPFVNAVATMADNKTLALAWLADAAALLSPALTENER